MPPIVYNGRVHFSSFDNYLYAVNISTGKEVWRFRTGKYGNSSSPFLHKNVFYQGSREGYFYTLTTEGKEIWRFRAGSVTVGIGIHKDNLYITSEDGNLYCLDLNGKEVWRFKASGPVFDFPSFYKNKIYVGSWDCRFYCIDENGEMVWSFNTSSQTIAPRGKAHETFEVEVKHETHNEEAKLKDKYKEKKEETVSLSEYQIESEYQMESEYKQKSDYDVQWVLFEGILEGEEIWTSDSRDLRPQTLM
ncbi:MAG: PQQ-like beta-propeller repeat protein [Candidatus Aenigmatarchaeota archaeon]|nr:MAG: PQQ-like beta-propeller repeat protein [Candidatus Aenigmarchaeota archaeon]